MKNDQKTQSFPGWPDSRNLSRYREITSFSFEKKGQHTCWIDFGCGQGRAISEWMQSDPSFKAIGIDISPSASVLPFQYYQLQIPQDLDFLQLNKATSDYSTDVYGPTTYSNDPVSTLIYITMTLKPAAEAAILTHASKFGSADKNLIHLKEKFRQIGISFRWARFPTLSDSANHPIEMLRIITSYESLKFSNIEELITEARKIIGRPIKKEIVWKSRQGGTAEIIEIDFPVD